LNYPFAYDARNNNLLSQETTIFSSLLFLPLTLASMQRLRDFYNAKHERQVPLNFLCSTEVKKAGIARDSIINAVGNIRATEANSLRAFRAGRQNAIQAKNIGTLHRAQVQRLAAIANEHAHLCYDFEESELIIHNIHWTIDPTCLRALRGCSKELDSNHYSILKRDPTIVFNPVQVIIRKWYSPAFTCTELEFHTFLWENAEGPF
jgi:hypothetical protein